MKKNRLLIFFSIIIVLGLGFFGVYQHFQNENNVKLTNKVESHNSENEINEKKLIVKDEYSSIPGNLLPHFKKINSDSVIEKFALCNKKNGPQLAQVKVDIFNNNTNMKMAAFTYEFHYWLEKNGTIYQNLKTRRHYSEIVNSVKNDEKNTNQISVTLPVVTEVETQISTGSDKNVQFIRAKIPFVLEANKENKQYHVSFESLKGKDFVIDNQKEKFFLIMEEGIEHGTNKLYQYWSINKDATN